MPVGEVTVTCLLEVPVEDAFAVFSDHIDRWWVRTPLTPADAVVRFEGDQLVMATSSGGEVLAMVTAWEPPRRIEMQWLGPHSEPGDSVIVEFEPEGAATRVTVRHRRTGLQPEEVATAVIGLWWADLLSRVRPGAAA